MSEAVQARSDGIIVRAAHVGMVVIASLLLLQAGSRAQTAAVIGTIVDSSRHRPLAGAHISVVGGDMGGASLAAASDSTGRFRLGGLYFRDYELRVAFLGYAEKTLRLSVDRPVVDAGVIALGDSVLLLREKLVEGRLIGTEVKGDTTEYSADAFETEPDATAEELVARLPGVAVDEDGDVKSGGEDVDQVLIDGQPYFGADPTLALRNLPSDAIAKIQVFDKLSDQSQLTGYDDGQSVKVLNIVTKEARRRGSFGKFAGGYGSDSRYSASTSLNLFDGNRRLSLIGLSNNINQQNFSQQDLLGVLGESNRSGRSSAGMFGTSGSGGSRSSGGGPIVFGSPTNSFLVGQVQGITRAHSFGFNHSDSLATGLSASTSYFFNLTDNANPMNLDRSYGFLPDSDYFYEESRDGGIKNYNHRITGRYDFVPDSSNEIVFTPRVYVQNNNSSNRYNGASLFPEGTPYAYVHGRHSSSTDGTSVRGNVIYRKKFSGEGRTLSVDIGTAVSHRTSTRETVSSVTYPTGSLGRPDSTNHESRIGSNGYGLSANMVYTEPLGANSLFQFNYEPSYTHGLSDDKAYDLDPATQQYTIFNANFSNTHETRYLTHRAGAGWRYRNDILSSIVGFVYQIADLTSDETFPRALLIDRRFFNILPNALITANLPGQRSFRLQYRTFTTAPTIYQLEDLVSKRNLLHLTAGNSDLRQSLSHNLAGRLALATLESGLTVFVHGFYTYTTDYLGDFSFIATHDTIVRRGIHLSKGAEFTYPVNLDHYSRLHTSATFGFPVDALSSSMTLGFGISSTSTPAFIRGLQNRSLLTTYGPELTLRNAASPTFDFLLSYNGTFNRRRNDVYRQLDENYFANKAAFRMHLYLTNRIVIRTDVNQTFTSGPADSLNRNLVLWNLYLGYKLFGNKRGELTFGIHNLLDETADVTHASDDTYVEDNQTLMLHRYSMVQFSYSFR